MPAFSHARLLALAATLLAAGCTVGPDYRTAPEVAANAIGTGKFPHAPAVADASAPRAADWWHALGDTQLDALIADALKQSPDIDAARARVRQARAGLNSNKANLLPKVGLDAAMLRTRSPDLSALSGEGSSGGGRGPMSLYIAGFDASWEIDLFGGTRRSIEAASAEADAASAQLADAHVQLAAEVAQAYVTLREQQASLAHLQASEKLEADMLDLTEQRRARGVASQLEVERLLTQLDNTRAQMSPVQAGIAESLDQIAWLTGRAPGALDAMLSTPQPLPAVPETVAVGDPAALLKARPDIRAAERRLASSTAQIGVRKADWFPKLSLLGSLGFSAMDPGHLARKDNGTWLTLPRLQWNILDFGRVAAGVDSAEGGRDEAEANYRGTVLKALRDADVALSRYGHQREHVVVLRRVEASAERASTLQQQRYRAGTASMLEWLDVERTRVVAQQDRISGDANLLKDFVSLQKALGLGWQMGS
ncbi:efflux transporter outer membrane subunit [Cupriavidus agavae]|uniref:NodT family efflux transporter outer membrane factor (OMF) lipoprotein n=1 Tax=Cupriavidus agavae TaxID=1001822 RepID=A0A4Q7RUB9_9BURK|nr:efflux transporter outer membrane subunit [Cupriavidus agavae]RZT36677.1 NodT family efflux transporter outer membrane factor (OMF) lipoprotein [Cupriavidus agavae]